MEMLQNSIRGYDSIVFTIKGWAITVFSGIILFAFDKQKPLLYLFCVGTILSFWLIDSYFKSTQNILIKRYRDIESFLRSTEFETAIAERSLGDFKVPHFQAYFNVSKVKRFQYLFEAASQFYTYSLYVFLLILTVGMLLLAG